MADENKITAPSLQEHQTNLLLRFGKKLQETLVKKLTPVNLALVVVYGMQVVETGKDLSGAAKKDVVLSLLREYILQNTSSYTDEERSELLLLLQVSVPPMIDLLVDASKQRLFPGQQRCCVLL